MKKSAPSGRREERNIERRSEETRSIRTNPALQRLNPDLPVAAIEGAVGEILPGFFPYGAEFGGGEPGVRNVSRLSQPDAVTLLPAETAGTLFGKNPANQPTNGPGPLWE